MDNTQVYHQLGSLTAEVKGMRERIDDFIEVAKKQEVRLQSLEISRATVKGHLKGMTWATTVAFSVASLLGAERIAQLMFHNV